MVDLSARHGSKLFRGYADEATVRSRSGGDLDVGLQVVQEINLGFISVHVDQLNRGNHLICRESERLPLFFLEKALVGTRLCALLHDFDHVAIEDEQEHRDSDQATAPAQSRFVNALLIQVQGDWHAELIT